MSFHIVGTAGHIDHGKSTLIKALTGIDPDRFAEEKRRGMTIDLGYAFLSLPSGRKVGIVDVPGHERFVRNMLAGAGGFDLVLLVVAADEGVMPQTREHLDILDLLEVKSGIVVLTKVDLAESEEWIELVEAEVISVLRNTTLEEAPIIRFSAKTGEGKEEIIKALDKILEKTPPKPTHLPARFPVDWVFSKPGFGTVVRGTLWEGKIRREEKLDLLPQEREVRIRGMQRHGEPITEGEAGQRIAINLAGVEKRELKRGDILVEKGAYRPTSLLDVELTLLENSLPLKHGDEYLFYLGAKETMVKVRLMERDVLKADEEGFAQLRLREPVVARRGDRFILRRPSPLMTIGGGVIVEAYPRPHHRFHAEEIQTLKRKLYASSEEYLLVLVSEKPGISLEEAYLHLALGKEAENLVKKMLEKGEIFLVAGSLYEAQKYQAVKEEILEKARLFFERHPQNPNIPKEELRTLCALSKKVFEEFLSHLEREEKISVQADKVRLLGVKSKLSSEEERIKREISALFEKRSFNPPTLKEMEEIFKGKEKLLSPLIKLLEDEGLILKIAPGLFFHRDALERAKEIAREKIREGGGLTPSQFKEALGTSRKYAIPLLEFFDKIKLTKREGDKRVLYS
jgi:selenocysteine-specific elongation factor